MPDENLMEVSITEVSEAIVEGRVRYGSFVVNVSVNGSAGRWSATTRFRNRAIVNRILTRSNL